MNYFKLTIPLTLLFLLSCPTTARAETPLPRCVQTARASHQEVTAEGHYSKAFQRERKKNHIKLRKYSAGGTVLYADTKLSKKRVTFVRNCIKALPKKVRKRAKRVYFVRKKYYMMTGNGLGQTSGYSMFPQREIWLYSVSDTDELMDTVFHEFGHCWDWDGKKFKRSNSNEWERIWITWLGGAEDPSEWFAYCFAEFFTYIQDPDFKYIYQSLNGAT